MNYVVLNGVFYGDSVDVERLVLEKKDLIGLPRISRDSQPHCLKVVIGNFVDGPKQVLNAGASGA